MTGIRAEAAERPWAKSMVDEAASCHEQQSNWLSRLVLWRFHTYLSIGKERNIDLSDLGGIMRGDRSEATSAVFDKVYTKDAEVQRARGRQPRLIRSLFLVAGRGNVLAGFCCVRAPAVAPPRPGIM